MPLYDYLEKEIIEDTISVNEKEVNSPTMNSQNKEYSMLYNNMSLYKLDKRFKNQQSVINKFTTDDISFSRFNDVIAKKEVLLRHKFLLNPNVKFHYRGNSLNITSNTNNI